MRAVSNRASVSAIIAATAFVGGFSVPTISANAAETLGPSTWTLTAPDTNSRAWVNGSNWSTAPNHPSGVGAAAIFNNDPARARNFSFTVTGTTSDPVSPAQPQVTFGSLTVNNTSAFTNNFTSGNNFVFLDAAGEGPAEINLLGSATSSGVPTTLGALWVLNDTLKLTVDKTASTSTVADVNVSGPMSGSGGLIKAGSGTAVITNGANTTKTFTGSTVVQAGRLRIGTQTGSPGAPLRNTASVTVDTSAQLDLGPNVASFLFGTSSATPINISGIGILPGSPIGGTFGSSGAIRAGVSNTLQNNIVVQSNDAAITSSGTGNVLTLSGVISGDAANRLQIGAFGNPLTQGSVMVTADNTYAGGTLVTQGTLVVSGASADLGSGDVLVDGASILFGNQFVTGVAAGRLTLSTGVLDAISDLATLTLTGDDVSDNGNPDAFVGGFATLESGINEIIAGLVLGATPQTTPGTYGSTASAATFQDDRYFQGTGVVTLVPVPEPTSLAALGIGAIGLLARRRRMA